MRRRHARVARPAPSGPRVNEDIRVPRVIVLDAEGNRLGEFMTGDAIQMARDHGLDLIEVAAHERPPICKLADWGKMKYQRQKKARAARARSSSSQMKELKVRPKTGDHDLGVKIRRAREFLESGDRVTITVWFRGREHAHRDIGEEQCLRVAEAVEDVAKIETQPRMQGRRMQMVLSPSS